jgi:hypothetical protein
VLLPGWISERRAFEKLFMALSTWPRPPGPSRIAFLRILGPALQNLPCISPYLPAILLQQMNIIED